MATKEEPAVIVKQAYKYYGSKSNINKKIVLNHLNMRVERGSIYGLLGSSGCGKTTLLSCVVGVRRLVSGHIEVLGKEGRNETRMIASRIGYMPQEVALVGEFSVRDAVVFFGRLYGLPESKIDERFDYLSKLLELPDSKRYIKNLSGGQQRRVSFAAALVHEPELLILDEPTVGLDPMLREKIWHHLVELSTTRKTAVIITTHYIEEARQANRIGLMRGGQLLAEESPETVMRMFGCESLEEAFLILSIKQSKADGGKEEPVIIETTETVDETPDPEAGEVKNHYDSKEDFSNMYSGSTDVLATDVTNNNNNGEQTRKLRLATKRQKYRALFTKSLQQFARHPGGLLFSAIFPIIQMMAFLLAVGHDIRVIHMGIVNEEVPYLPDCYNTSLVTALYNPEEYTCSYNKLSCRYIKSLDDDIYVKYYYNTLEEGLHAVNTGKVVGVLHIAQNFSESLYLRTEEGSNDEFGIENSFLNFYLDMSNHQISYFTKRRLYDDYEVFAKALLVDCKSSPKLGNIPVNFKDPIYGTKSTSYTDFMAPGLMATVLFFLATTATSNLMITDKLEGVWDRTIVAGVDSKEILTVHIVIQSMVILMQVVEVMLLTFLGYQVPFRGDISTVAILLCLQGFVGMAYGFLVSIMCNSYSVAFFVSTGSFYPLILLCGIVWPIEGMQTGLRIFSLFLPFTIPIRSLRNVIEKGYPILEFQVLNGYIVSVVWIVFLLSCCFIILRIQK